MPPGNRTTTAPRMSPLGGRRGILTVLLTLPTKAIVLHTSFHSNPSPSPRVETHYTDVDTEDEMPSFDDEEDDREYREEEEDSYQQEHQSEDDHQAPLFFFPENRGGSGAWVGPGTCVEPGTWVGPG